MAAFRFKLEPVLELRRRAEREQQMQVAAVERERAELEDALRTVNGKLEAERRDWRDRVAGQAEGPAGGGAVDLGGVKRQATASVGLIAQAQRLVLQLAGVHTRLERAREALREVSTQRRAVEVLRERQLEAWTLEQTRREARELDDLTVMRHGREQGFGTAEPGGTR